MQETSFSTAAHTVRWLVSDGWISLDGFRYPPFAIQASIWVCLVLGSCVTLAWAQSSRPRMSLPLLFLAAAAVVLSACGYFTPFSWWRAIVYCQATGDSQFTFNLNIFFALPWFLGTMSLVAGICRKAALTCPSCGRQVLSFTRIWLRYPFRVHRCPACDTGCRVGHARWYLLIGAFLVLAITGVAYVCGGWPGVLAVSIASIPLDAWYEYRMIRLSTLPKTVGQKNDQLTTE
jgi:hypothetical protein